MGCEVTRFPINEAALSLQKSFTSKLKYHATELSMIEYAKHSVCCCGSK
jgi:hypothetical protein